MREYGFTDADGRQPDWGRHIHAAISELLRTELDAGRLPSSGDVEATRRAAREVFERHGLAVLTIFARDGFYQDLHELGTGSDRATVDELVSRHFDMG